jgi:hypothetical protein
MTPARLFLAAFAVGCVLSSMALAYDTRRWSTDSHVTFQPSAQPGAVGEVVFLNDEIHTTEETFTLDLDGVTITVRMDPDRSALNKPDTMHVTPPKGFIAVPEQITVPEGGAGVVVIYEEGMS